MRFSYQPFSLLLIAALVGSEVFIHAVLFFLLSGQFRLPSMFKKLPWVPTHPARAWSWSIRQYTCWRMFRPPYQFAPFTNKPFPVVSSYSSLHGFILTRLLHLTRRGAVHFIIGPGLASKHQRYVCKQIADEPIILIDRSINFLFSLLACPGDCIAKLASQFLL